jgi:hypothetical protein
MRSVRAAHRAAATSNAELSVWQRSIWKFEKQSKPIFQTCFR